MSHLLQTPSLRLSSIKRCCFPALQPLSPSGRGGHCHPPCSAGLEPPSCVQPAHLQPFHTTHARASRVLQPVQDSPPWRAQTAARSLQPQPFSPHAAGLSWSSPRGYVARFDCPAGPSLINASPLSEVLQRTNVGWHGDQPQENPRLANTSKSGLILCFVLILYSYNWLKHEKSCGCTVDVQHQILPDLGLSIFVWQQLPQCAKDMSWRTCLTEEVDMDFDWSSHTSLTLPEP